MINYSVEFKIEDYKPKIDTISYSNFICLLIYKGFQLRMSLTDNKYNNQKHILKNIKSDLYYKITLFDDKTKTLIGINDFIIPYKLLYKINSNNYSIFKKEIKFIISNKTKMQLFNSVNNLGKMSIYLTAKISKQHKYRKNSKKYEKINNKCLSPAITERASFIQKINKNLIKAKVDINKNKIYKNKDRYFSTDSNKLISTNDLSGNQFNTYSNIDDCENNTNNYINNISTINNIYNQNYFFFNTTSGKEELKNNKNNINIIYNEDNNKKKSKHKYQITEGNEILGIRNKLNKRLKISKTYNNKKEEKKYSVRNFKKNIPYKYIIIKSKTRNSFNSYLKTKNRYTPASEDESTSQKIYKNKMLKSINDVKNNNLCESYSNKNYLKTEIKTKTKKIKTIISSFINKDIQSNNKNKFISLSKDKNDKNLNNNKKFHTENFSNKVLLFDKLNISKSKSLKEKKIKKKIKKMRVITDDNINIKLSSLSKTNINKVNTNKSNSKSKNNNNNKHNKEVIDNSTKIKVKRKVKNKNDNIININVNNYENEQIELKKKEIKFFQYFILNNKNIKSINLKLKENNKKLIQTKEIFFNLLKESNRLKEKKSSLYINKFILNNIKNNFNIKVKLPLLYIKKKEFSIYEKIFNFSFWENDINKYIENEKIIEEKIFKLQLSIIKNLVKHYGNISQIYINDFIKKERLKNILYKNNIIENEKENKNNFIDLVALNKINTSVKKIIKSTFNNNVKYNYNIIKEVQEEKESEKNSNLINKTSNISSLMNDINDISDEILFIDRRDIDMNEGNMIYNKNKNNNTSDINYFRNDYSNSIKDNSSKKNEYKYNNEKKIKKNIRKELIGLGAGIEKKKFKGKMLNFDEFCFDYDYKIPKKDNVFKIGFFNKKKD